MDLTLARLSEIPNLTVSRDAPLAAHTRFAIGGPADIYVETESADSFIRALGVARASGCGYMVMGGGTNLIVSDAGFRGIMLRFVAHGMTAEGDRIACDAGAVLQDLVDFSIANGLQGLETLAGIPGSVGAAIYGNAGAYGHSISECIRQVRFFDGERVRVFDRAACEFRYRESTFKGHKDWIIFSSALRMAPADAALLRETADGILKVRNEKFPVTMKCAGSIFKNFLLVELPSAVAARIPAEVIREHKVPAAYFLEQVGAKGMSRGDIHVAAYHANLIYNAGRGTAADLCALIGELKDRVRARFAIELEEEVQYVGFADACPVA
ncbi:MAG TPA: UDP-N-acetylmuramate dehydrogenase [Bryobacteraceae bacterium]|nr:UDP-N-acetylmuramate dehydrogenase [Bryobacteraceae bacterium]